MSDKDAAKRRRQARNRQERMNRQKRIEGARRSEAARRTDGSGRPSRSADSAASTGGGGGLLSRMFPAKATPAASSSARGATPSRATSGRPAADEGDGGGTGRPSRSQPMVSPVVEVDDEQVGGLRAAIGLRLVQPGGRAVLLGFAFTVMLAIALVAVPLVPRAAFEGYGRILIEDAPVSETEREAQKAAFEDGDQIDLGTVRFAQIVPTVVVAAFALAPMMIAAVAVRSLTRPTRSRTLLFCAMAMGMIVFFAPQLLTFAMPALIALGFGAYQSRKADQPALAPG